MNVCRLRLRGSMDVRVKHCVPSRMFFSGRGVLLLAGADPRSRKRGDWIVLRLIVRTRVFVFDHAASGHGQMLGLWLSASRVGASAVPGVWAHI